MTVNARQRVRCGAVGLLLLISIAPAARAGGGAAALFAPEAFMDHVRYLSSDALAGRDSGTPGNDQAAAYIVARLQALGLEPAGENGTFLQHFELRDGKTLNAQTARLEVEGLERTWTLGSDWTPFPFSAAAAVEGPLAFAGYGISAPDDGYDDFEGFDAAGKLLLVFRGEPKAADKAAVIGGGEPSRHALFRTKARTASRKGAIGLLLVNTRPAADGQDELYAFDSQMGEQTYELPMAHLSRPAAAALLARAGLPGLDELQEQLEKERTPRSRDVPGLRIRLTPGVEPAVRRTQNVLGLLRGAAAPDEYIVLGAHYDHVGTRTRQFQRRDNRAQVHNGADDNASGTAGLLELARVLAAGPRPRRSLLLIFFSGEERGLLGSKHFVQAPTVPLEQIKAMLNFDMIGRLSLNRFTIYGIPTAREFGPLVERAAAAAGVRYTAAGDVPGNSDHAPFHRKKIPVLFPFTGIHKQYHQPEDDWERIDAGGAARVLTLSHEIIREIAEMTAGPTWTEAALPEGDIGDAPSTQGTPDVSQLNAAEARAAAARAADAADAAAAAARPERAAPPADEAAGPRMPRVRLGIMPDYAGGDAPGLGVEGLVEGGVAQRAGFKEGDRIVRIGDEEVRDIRSYMEALASVKPGDTVEFTVQRGGQTLKLPVTFPAQTPRRDGQ